MANQIARGTTGQATIYDSWPDYFENDSQVWSLHHNNPDINISSGSFDTQGFNMSSGGQVTIPNNATLGHYVGSFAEGATEGVAGPMTYETWVWEVVEGYGSGTGSGSGGSGSGSGGSGSGSGGSGSGSGNNPRPPIPGPGTPSNSCAR